FLWGGNMAESQCMRVRLKVGKTDEFLRWARSFPDRMNEVREALKSEGIITEQIFLERTDEGDSIVFFTKAESLVKANQAFEKSSLPIDPEAKRIMAETWDFSSVRPLEVVVDL